MSKRPDVVITKAFENGVGRGRERKRERKRDWYLRRDS
jgi:hypothetical protein